MSWLAWFYLGCLVWSGLLMILCSAWDFRNPKHRAEDGTPLDEYGRPLQITLGDLALGVFYAVFPIVNMIVGAVLTCYALSQIAPKIVVFGKK